MSEAIFERLVAIVENGTYAGSSLGAKALRTFPDTLDGITKPVVLILPRANNTWQKEAGSSIYQTSLSYDMHFFIQEAKAGNDAIGLTDATNFEELATKIFLSRPQLQLAGQTPVYLTQIVEDISLQTTSNLANPILYPPNGVSTSQGATPYWGFIMRISIPYRLEVTLSFEG
jgi:hypothetical protein